MHIAKTQGMKKTNREKLEVNSTWQEKAFGNIKVSTRRFSE
jgi:hypothetical protein